MNRDMRNGMMNDPAGVAGSWRYRALTTFCRTIRCDRRDRAGPGAQNSLAARTAEISTAADDVIPQYVCLGLKLFQPVLHHVADADDAAELTAVEDR